MISLGGIVLDNSLIWEDRHQSQGVAQTVRRTLGGSPVVFTGRFVAGLPITLVASSNFGWLTKAQVDQVLALAAVPAGQYPLIYGAQTFLVMFRHDEPPAVDMVPNLARQTHGAADWFTGSIKLLTV